MRLTFVLNIFLFLFGGGLVSAQNYIWSDIRESCVPFNVRFALDTNELDMDTISRVLWNFGNGVTLEADDIDTVTTRYLNEVDHPAFKLYDVSVTFLNTPQSGGQPFSGFIKAHESIDSDFDMIVDATNDLKYSFVPNISELATDAEYTFIWTHDIGTEEIRRAYPSVNNPLEAVDEQTFADTGSYTSQLEIREVWADYTCRSITKKDLKIVYRLKVGNIFTPLSTPYYIIDPENTDVILSFKLFTRTGLKVFQQDAPIIYWDGRNAAGLDMGTGVYFYIVEPIQGDSELYTKRGFIHLFR